MLSTKNIYYGTSAYTTKKGNDVISTIKVLNPITKSSITSTGLSTWLKVKCACGIKN